MRISMSLFASAVAFTLSVSTARALDNHQAAYISYLTAKIAADPQNADLVHFRGEAYMKFGDLPKAIIDLKRALELKPNDPPTLDGLGAVYMREKQWEKAINAFDEVLSKVGFTNSLYARGYAKKMIGDSRGGDADIAKAKMDFADVENRWHAYYGISLD